MEEIQFLQGLEVLVDGKMEDHCRHLSHIDFANKHIGGGVLQFVRFAFKHESHRINACRVAFKKKFCFSCVPH